MGGALTVERMGRGRRQRTASKTQIRTETRALPLTRVITAKGVPIDLSYDWDHQDGIQSPFVVHRLSAQVEGEAAGYVKVAYVPRSQILEALPDALHFALHRHGHQRVYDLVRRSPIEHWSGDDLQTAIACARILPSLGQMTRAELIGSWEKAAASLAKRHVDEYAHYIDAHVDKPRVDYIRVFDKGDRTVPRERDSPQATRSFRRLGVATALYETAARWMAANRMTIWASGLQQPEAAAAWEKLAARGLVRSVVAADGKTRRFFDVAALEAEAAADVGMSRPASSRR